MVIKKDWPFLSEEEAKRLFDEGKNNSGAKIRKSKKNIWITNLFTFYNMLNIVLAVLIATTGSYRNMFFILIVIANYLIGTIQELRARKYLASLSIVADPKASVIRDGKIMTISSESLVLGDMVILHSGDQIMADGKVVSGEIRINESLITGENEPVIKSYEDEVRYGSFVISGEAAVKLTAVGMDRFADKIIEEGKKLKHAVSELKEIMKKIIKVVSAFIIPMGVISFISHYVWQDIPYADSMISSVASMVGMIPDGLYLLMSISFAAGVIRLVKRNTLVQQMYSLESLARVDTLCLDKTGTITTGKMKVSKVIPFTDDDIGNIISLIYSTVPVDNETAKALICEFESSEIKREALDFLPFSSDNKFVAADFGNGDCFVLGAPESVLKNECFSNEIIKSEKYESDGLRCLALTRAERKEKIYSAYKIIAFILIEDEIRHDADKTFGYFYENDVDIKVISGDSAKTVSNIAGKAGIKNADKYLDLTGISEKEIRENVENYTVFGRAKPEHKKIIINELKKLGHKVAMTGDGVNDILGLKESDCSVAMANGSQAAIHASQIVLADSDFTSMPEIVKEGRMVINNIQSSASLFLMKTMYSFAVTVIAILFGFGYPFMPIQLTFISLAASAIPGLLLSFEPSYERIKDNFVKRVLSRAILGALTIAVGITTILVCGDIFHFSLDEISTICVIFTGFSSLVTLFCSLMPLTGYKKVIMAVSLSVFVFGLIFLGKLLEFVSIQPVGYIVLIILCIVSLIQYFLRGEGIIWKAKE